MSLIKKTSIKIVVECTERKRSASSVPVNTRHLTNLCYMGVKSRKTCKPSSAQEWGVM